MFAELKPHARCLGWAFLLAWVFCVFYSGSMDGLATTVEQQTGGGPTALLFNVLPVGSAVATLIAIVAAEKKAGPPTNSRRIIVGAPIIATIATPVLLVPMSNALLSSILFAIASIATGIGSGLMWVMWGQLYAKLPQDAVESCAPVSAVIAAVLSLAVMIAPPAPTIVIVTAFPLISGILFAKEWPHVAATEPADHALAPAQPAPLGKAMENMGHAGFGILTACLFVSVEGSFWISGRSGTLPAAGIFIASALFMLSVSVSATAGPRRVSLGFAYRWMCPVMVAGFAALIVAGPERGAYVAAMVGISARFAFCLITQMYFAVYAARGKATAVQAYGMGWIFVHLGDLLGVMISTPLKSAIGYGVVSTSTAAAVLIVAIVAAFMFTMGEGNMFPNWGFEQRTSVDRTRAGSLPASAGRSLSNGGEHAATMASTRLEAGASADGAKALAGKQAFAGDASGAKRSAEAESQGNTNAQSTGNATPITPACNDSAMAAVGVSASSPMETPTICSTAVGAASGSSPAFSPAQTPGFAAGIAEATAPADPIAARIAELAAAHKLTPRETEVFELLAHGRSIPYVRDALFISRDTAATHAKHIYSKLDVHSRQELIDLVMAQGPDA